MGRLDWLGEFFVMIAQFQPQVADPQLTAWAPWSEHPLKVDLASKVIKIDSMPIERTLYVGGLSLNKSSTELSVRKLPISFGMGICESETDQAQEKTGEDSMTWKIFGAQWGWL
jgi:hypothetical protein